MYSDSNTFLSSAEVSSLSGGNEASPRVTRLSSQLAMSTVLAKSSVGMAGISWNLLEEVGLPHCAIVVFLLWESGFGIQSDLSSKLDTRTWMVLRVNMFVQALINLLLLPIIHPSLLPMVAFNKSVDHSQHVLRDTKPCCPCSSSPCK